MAARGPALDAINAIGRADFARALGHIFERSSWIAEAAWAERPFKDIAALHDAMMRVVSSAPRERQIDLLRAHPELAGREAQAGALTESSTSEQRRLGFDALQKDELALMTGLNRDYREKFGFPCIIALRAHADRASVLAEHRRRLGNDPDGEIANALAQIGIIARGRLDALLAGS